MKLVGLILVGLYIGFESASTWAHPFGVDCLKIYLEQSFRTSFLDYKFSRYCRKSSYREQLRQTSTQIPPSTKSDNIPFSSDLSSEARFLKVLNSLSSKGNITKDPNPETTGNFSAEPSSILKRTTEDTNSKVSDDKLYSSTKAPKEMEVVTGGTNSSDASTGISEESKGTTYLASDDVLGDSSSTQSSNSREENTEITNTDTSDNISTEISVATDVSSEITNSTASDVHSSDETPEGTSDATNFTIPEVNNTTESTEETDAKDSNFSSTHLPTTLNVTSDEKTLVTDDFTATETSDLTDEVSETLKSELPTTADTETTESQPVSHVSDSTTPETTVFMSTDYSTSEKTNSDIDGGSSITLSSSTDKSKNPSTTRLYSTERDTTVTTSPKSPETTVDNIETTHTITNIELAGTKTLKLAVSITFLVIATISLVVLIGYFIATRRRTFSYDELMLLP